MIFVGGGVTVEGNGAQPVDVQTAVFGPEDARKAVRSGDAGEADLFVAVEPAAGQAVGVVFRFVGGFGFFFEVVFVNGGLAFFVVDVRQRDFPPLLVDIKKAVGGADKAHGEGQRPALAQPAVARLIGIVAALPDQR